VYLVVAQDEPVYLVVAQGERVRLVPVVVDVLGMLKHLVLHLRVLGVRLLLKLLHFGVFLVRFSRLLRVLGERWLVCLVRLLRVLDDYLRLQWCFRSLLQNLHLLMGEQFHCYCLEVLLVRPKQDDRHHLLLRRLSLLILSHPVSDAVETL